MTAEYDDLSTGHTPERDDHKKQEKVSAPVQGLRRRSEGYTPTAGRSRLRKRRRNALKHGLSVPIKNLPYFQKTIAAWHAAIIHDIEARIPISEEVNAVAFEIAVHQCELVRIALIRQAITAHPALRQKSFSTADRIHLMTVIEGFVVEPRTSPIPFDTRAMSMLYRIFGIRSSEQHDDVPCPNFSHYQIQALSSLERYETRSRSRLRKATKRLQHLLDV